MCGILLLLVLHIICVVLLLVCNLCVCMPHAPRLSLKGGCGIFNTYNSLKRCCAEQYETGTDEFAQALRQKKRKTVLHLVASRINPWPLVYSSACEPSSHKLLSLLLFYWGVLPVGHSEPWEGQWQQGHATFSLNELLLMSVEVLQNVVRTLSCCPGCCIVCRL